jgi:hypothetical protein
VIRFVLNSEQGAKKDEDLKKHMAAWNHEAYMEVVMTI